MIKIKQILFFSFFLFYNVSAQNKDSFKLNKATIDELKMVVYKKDSIAKAVILEEKGHIYVDHKNDYNFRKNIYRRIKIFDQTEFDQATINIDLYDKEKIKYIQAVSYNYEDNKMYKINLTKDKIYRKKVSEKWTEVSFTLPNIQKGSVIEYTYSIISPYSKLDDWIFQSDIPKVKSDFSFSIPGNYHYNIRFQSYQPLARKESSIKKDCLEMDGAKSGSCAESKFGMDHIPAFKKEKYMLAERNYKSKLTFELISYKDIYGYITKYTKTWKDADKTLKKNFFDNQTSKKNYFKKKLPKELLLINNKLEKAKRIYKHLQNRLTWNNKYWTPEKLRVKNIYDNKIGAVDGLNITLFNALKAANIETNLVVLSTRNNRVLTKIFPSVSEFNYIVVKASINDKSYFLDITDKDLLFGEIPFRTLNGEGRVLDFKKGGYWESINPKRTSYNNKQILLKFDNNLNITGKIKEIDRGYFALKKRKEINLQTEEEYLNSLEDRYPYLEIDNFKSNIKESGKLETTYDIIINDIDNNNTIKLNPFIIDRITTNPFTLKKRNYPVDFGFKQSKTYVINIETPKGYKLLKYPKSFASSLPNNGGKLLVNSSIKENKLTIYFKFFSNKISYNNIEYQYLKELYNIIIKTQNSYLEYKKL